MCIVNKMRLNTLKCKTMLVGTNSNSPVPATSINGTALEMVNSYKYLGIEIKNKLNWEAQWSRVLKQTRTVPYLVKSLKRVGFRTQVLVDVYRSFALSHISYSAPLLSSASSIIKAEMNSFEKRILRIINISESEVRLTYNLPSIQELIDTTCMKLLKRILSDPAHPLSAKVPKVGRSTAQFQFKTNKAKREAYANSFVQKTIRMIRDGTADSSTPRVVKQSND